MGKNKKIKIKNFLSKLIFKKNIQKKYENIKILKIKDIDSLTIFKTIIKIESKYKIKLSDKEIFSKKFDNIKNITQTIIEKTK